MIVRLQLSFLILSLLDGLLVQAFSQDSPNTMACMLLALGGKVGRAVSWAWSTAERTEESGLKKVTAGQQAGSGRDIDPAVRSEG